MGRDSISPFLQYPEKAAILLALTSNLGHIDFEMQKLENGKRLYEQVIETSLSWPKLGDLMYVIGANRTQEIENVRRICPDNFLLVPGVGAQGGSLQEISKYGLNSKGGLLINASRSIIYSGNGMDFAKQASDEAEKLQKEMSLYL
jgi:orotidine-5'-phosphate decarboxylase